MVPSFLRRRCRRRMSAYSLMEVALVLLIIGTVGMGFLPLLGKVQGHQRHTTTLEHLRLLEAALETYALTHNGAYPCPSFPHGASADFGLAPGVCPEEGYAFIGIVPFRTLGVSATIARDGYGQWFTYVLGKPPPAAWRQPLGKIFPGSSRLSIPGSSSTPHLEEDDDRGGVIKLASLGPGGHRYAALDEGESMVVGYILISHGPNKQGAFTGKGRERFQGHVRHELLEDNSQDSTSFLEAPRQDKPYFDHVLRWKSLHRGSPR